MSKWMKKYGLLVCVIITIIFVVLENNGFFAGKAGESKEAEASSDQEVPGGESSSYAMDIPYEYKADINGQNQIDAAINVPDTVREEGFKKASARMAEVPETSILALLEEYYHPYEGEEYESDRQYLGEDDLCLNFSKEYPEFSLYCRTASYIGMAYRNQATEDCNQGAYTIDQDLPNFPLSDCDRRIEELFQTYGVESKLHIVHNTLDYKIMEREALELRSDGSQTKPDYKWSRNDDSYYCMVWQMCNGIPVTHGYMLTSYADILNRGSHNLVLNKERFLQINMTEVYDIRYSQEREALLGFEEVLERYARITEAAENYAIKITDIALRVTGVKEKSGEYRMEPIWIFYGIKTYGEEGISAPFAIMIDAVTGDALWEL